MPEDLEPLLKRYGMDGTVAVQADESLTETNFLLELALRYPFIKKVVGWVDFEASDLEEQLETLSQNEKLVGFRHVLQDKEPEYMYGKQFRKGLVNLSKHGFTYDLLIYPPHLEAAVDLVKDFPKQPFVIDHLAKPNIKTGEVENWLNGMAKIARFPNVSCKLSGLVTEADWYKWQEEDFYYFLEVVFGLFGTERLMYGSDWPVCLLAAAYQQTQTILKNYVNKLTATEKASIMGLNACNFYKIDLD